LAEGGFAPGSRRKMVLTASGVRVGIVLGNLTEQEVSNPRSVVDTFRYSYALHCVQMPCIAIIQYVLVLDFVELSLHFSVNGGKEMTDALSLTFCR
jgi:hypothetical protein